MNLKTANRLQQLRKANGYSQEVLAEKLGVSRQSVSKWERGESSPEIDNLVAISEIYGITLDELLSESDKEIIPNEEVKHDFFAKTRSLLSKANDFGIYSDAARKLTKFPFPVFITALYFTLSIMFNMWHPFWLIFMTIPIFYRFAIACKANNKKVFALLLPIPEIIVTFYLASGFLFDVWKYASFLFLLIPLYFWFVPYIYNNKKQTAKTTGKE